MSMVAEPSARLLLDSRGGTTTRGRELLPVSQDSRQPRSQTYTYAVSHLSIKANNSAFMY